MVPTQEDLTDTIALLIMSMAAAAQPNASSTKKTTFLDVFNTYLTSINITTREGINTYKTMIKPVHACICKTVSVKTATHMMDLCKDKEIQYGLDGIFRIPKSSTCVS